MNTSNRVSLIFLATVIACIQLSSAQTCPDAKVVSNFDITKFTGRWYFINRFFEVKTKLPIGNKLDKVIKVLDGSCSLFDLKYDSNAKSARVDFQTVISGQTFKEGVTEKDVDGDVTWKKSISGYSVEIDVTLTGTDYTNYAVVFACGGVTGAGTAKAAWILSRNRTLDQTYVKQATDILTSQNLIPNNAKFNAVVQSKCKN